MSTLTYTGTLQICSCWCGIRLAVPVSLYDEAKRHGKAIHCPIGHTFVYGNTLEKQLSQAQREAAEAQRRVRATRDLLDHEQRSHAATRGHLTRHKKRAAAGVCPCCNRTFQQLARHMAGRHPGYVRENG